VKLRYLLVFSVIAACLFSCHSKDCVIYDNLDSTETAAVDHSDEYYGDFAEEETYEPTTTEDLDGIIFDYSIYNGNYYFNTNYKSDTRNDDGTVYVDMISYVGLTTGNLYYMCPDPLCRHNDKNECAFYGLQLASSKIVNNFMLAIRMFDIDSNTGYNYESLYKINLSDNTVKLLYKTEDTGDYIHVVNSCGDKYYFTLIHRYIVDNTEDAASADMEEYYLYSIDTLTDKIELVGKVPDEFSATQGPMFIDGKKMYFCDAKNLYTTDMSFGNVNYIYKTAGDGYVGRYYFDTNTDEFFFGVTDDDANTGSIYVSKSGGYAEKLSMPDENICYFQITNTHIYYSVYDPIDYGKSPRGGEAYDYTGGKIYVTDRNDRTKSSLLLDCGGKLVLISGYTVIGDYVYFDYANIISDNGTGYFSSADQLKKVRINVKEHTIKYLRFE
jgi:hypothetical protein